MGKSGGGGGDGGGGGAGPNPSEFFQRLLMPIPKPGGGPPAMGGPPPITFAGMPQVAPELLAFAQRIVKGGQ
jgi:hypothetical protein